MKKFFTLTLIAFFSILLSSQAQVVNKGDRLFGGSFTFSVFDLKNDPQTSYSAGNVGISPSFGWAIKDNLLMGIKGTVSFNHSANKYNNGDKSTSNSFNFAPGVFLKKYKLLKNKFGLYFDHTAGMSYFSSKQKSPPAYDEIKSHGWIGSYNFNPGVFYKFSENFLGEGNIGGIGASYYSSGGSTNYGVYASFLQQFNLGINYRIPKRKSL